MQKLPSQRRNTCYYPQALLQFMLYKNNLRETYNILQEIDTLKTQISSKQKKHRRCDKQIQKDFQCDQCSKVYASEVALKLHWKLKHKTGDDRSTLAANQGDHYSADLGVEVHKSKIE